MAKIKTNVGKLTVPQKLIKGAEVIALGSANPNVPGNAALITAMTAAQNALQAAEEAAEAARNIAKQRTADRNAALEGWIAAINNLAGFTQTATDGDAGKILSAGFDICRPPTPLPPAVLTAPVWVSVALNGTPGHSKVTWSAVDRADGYLVQGSPDPITATSWRPAEVAMKAPWEGNGATAGQKYWYRVAAFDGTGQGPWSQPAERPVM